LSSLTSKNLAEVVTTVLVSEPLPQEPLSPAILQALLQSAVGFDEPRAMADLVDYLVAPREGFREVQFAALAGWLDALDQRNTPLAQLAEEAVEPLQASLRRLGGVFDNARQIAADPAAAAPQRIAALRLLARGPDRLQEDFEL